MGHPKMKKLLLDIAEEIRQRTTADEVESEFRLNLAAVVEHMDPDPLMPAPTEVATKPKFKPASDYKIVDGTYYDKRSSDTVIQVMEHCRKTCKKVQIYHGYTNEYPPQDPSPDKPIGEDWLEEGDVIGRIARSSGEHKVPIILESGQIGGPEVSCYTIIRIRDVKAARDLYRHPKYRQPKLTMGPTKNNFPGQKPPGMAEAVYADGVLNAQFHKVGQAAKWAKKFGWEIS